MDVEVHGPSQLCTLLALVLCAGAGASSSIVNMRKVTHPTVQQPLAGEAVLPCVFTLPNGSSAQTVRLLWTLVRLPAGGQESPLEHVVLSAQGNTKTKKKVQN